MDPLEWIEVGLGILFAAIVGLAVWGVEENRVKDLEQTIQTMKDADAKATATFEAQAALKQKDYDDAAAAAKAKYEADLQARASDVARLTATASSLQHTIDQYATDTGKGLPAACGSGSGDEGRAQTLGGLLESCLAVARQSATDAESLADQVRYYQTMNVVPKVKVSP